MFTSKTNLELELKLNLSLIIVAYIPFEDVRSCIARLSNPSHYWNHEIFGESEKSTSRFVLLCHNMISQHIQHNSVSLSQKSPSRKRRHHGSGLETWILKIETRIIKIVSMFIACTCSLLEKICIFQNFCDHHSPYKGPSDFILESMKNCKGSYDEMLTFVP